MKIYCFGPQVECGILYFSFVFTSLKIQHICLIKLKIIKLYENYVSCFLNSQIICNIFMTE